MKDYYAILGLTRQASDEEIKRAFRKLAMKHHPDRGGDQARFQEINEAYNTLSDPERRRDYDNPGVRININNMSGAPFDFDEIFSMFGAQFRGAHPAHNRKSVARVQIWLNLQDLTTGGRRLVSIGTRSGNYEVEIDLPAEIEDGTNVRYPDLGPDNTDLVVTYRIRPDPKWQRNGSDIMTTMPISALELIVGANVQVRDLTGHGYDVTIPRLTQNGTRLRMKGLGLLRRSGDRGDLYVEVQARIPDAVSPELSAAISNELAGK